MLKNVLVQELMGSWLVIQFSIILYFYDDYKVDKVAGSKIKGVLWKKKKYQRDWTSDMTMYLLATKSKR